MSVKFLCPINNILYMAGTCNFLTPMVPMYRIVTSLAGTNSLIDACELRKQILGLPKASGQNNKSRNRVVVLFTALSGAVNKLFIYRSTLYLGAYYCSGHYFFSCTAQTTFNLYMGFMFMHGTVEEIPRL